jgi:predicted RNase H-like HicB family nuclease
MQSQHTDGSELKYPEGVNDSVTGRVEALVSAEQFRVTGEPFLRPLLITVEKIEDDQFLVSDELLNCYGLGDTLEEATEDLATMLIEHRAELAASRDKLSTHLRRQLGMLDYFLGPRC